MLNTRENIILQQLILYQRQTNIPFLCVLNVHITPKAEQYSPKYFGINSCRNIIFSCVLSAHIISNAKQYSLEYS